MIIGPVKAVKRMINRLEEREDARQQRSVQRAVQAAFVGAQRIIWLSDCLVWLESQRHEFVRHILQELKTPQPSMREGIELLADEVAGPLTGDQKTWWVILDHSSRYLQKLIEQLLDYNQQAGRWLV